jgi:drug/metabolite transporter (DMT)-like permease
MFYVMGWGWLFTTFLFLGGPGFGDYQNLSSQGWWAIGFLGVVCSGLAYIAWYEALEVLPASQVGVFLYIEPLVTVAVAAVLLAEPITITSLLGGAGIILGVWSVNRPKGKNQLVDGKAR